MKTIDEVVQLYHEKAKDVKEAALIYGETHKRLIKAIPDYKEEYEHRIVFAKELEQIACWLEELKAYKKADNWTPCAERLPDRNDTDYVLVTVSIPDRPYDIILLPTNCVEQEYKKNHISAWRPLPVPYKGDNK